VARWLVPTLGYVVFLGALGVTSKLALRSLPWQTLILCSGIGYIFTAAILSGLGQVRIEWDIDLFWAVASAALAIAALILLYVALGSGEASKVVPISAAYPAVTLVLAAIFLGEALTVARAGGMLLVIAGVIVLTSVK
jgi:bacterial/archaeal transporter family protein